MDIGKKPIDERVIIDTNSDKTMAFISFKEPEAGGKRVTRDSISEMLSKMGIVYGIDHNMLETLASGNRSYNKKYLIAKGENGENGVDGGLRFFFDIKRKSHAPKVATDGTVDYKNLELIENVHAGDVLVEIVNPSESINGMNVFGKEIPKISGKQAPKLPKGKNTEISEDGKSLFSMVSGQVIYINNVVNVSEILEIDGNVDNSTGNINFNGSVVVKGNLITGFKIIANGNVDIQGFVEGGDIVSKGNISVKKEIIGMNKSYIECLGSITCMLIKNAKVFAGENIYADGIMHSDVKCDGRVQLKGKKGVLVGGNIVCKNEIDANVIGSPMATATDIKVGIDVEVFEKYKQGMEELSGLNKRFEELSLSVGRMGNVKDLNSLPEVKKRSYIKIVSEARELKEQIQTLHKEVYGLKEMMEQQKHSGRVYGRNVMYSGINIQIGNAAVSIKDNIFAVMALNENGKIRLVNLV